MQETWVRSPGEGNGNPLQYSCLRNSTDREPGRLQSVGLQRVGHHQAINTSWLFLSYSLFLSFRWFYLLNSWAALSHYTSCLQCCSLLGHLSFTQAAGRDKMLSYRVTSPPCQVILRIKFKLPCLPPVSPLALSATLPAPSSHSSPLPSTFQAGGSTCSSLTWHSLVSFCARCFLLSGTLFSPSNLLLLFCSSFKV